MKMMLLLNLLLVSCSSLETKPCRTIESFENGAIIMCPNGNIIHKIKE